MRTDSRSALVAAVRIAIYDRYWHTRGGGERYAGVMAEILSQEHRVELLGPDPVDLTGLADHLGLNLSRCSFRLLPPVSERKLAPLTTEYDLFINCTYLSRLPARAKRSLYLVLFPQKAWPASVIRSGRRLVATATAAVAAGSHQFAPVVALDGFYEPDPSGARWTRNAARLRVQPWAFRRGRARLRLSPPKLWSLEQAILDVRAPGVSWRIEGRHLVLERPGPAGEGAVDVELRIRTFVPSERGLSPDGRHLGVYLPDQTIPQPWARVQGFAERLEGYIDGHDAEIPASYDLLVAISDFTRRWVAKRWGRPSEVLAPPVDTATFSAPDPGAKRKVILSVGRFFHGHHNKKHLEMLRVFRRMVDRGQIPQGWEYHLAGNLHRNRLVDLEYFAELERLAEGYPVKLLVDLSLERLVDEYRRASIFWHAAGWGESERRQPEKLEHFGLTTCEAMSSGCIPVVIAKAGQLEIVEHGTTGFLFTNARELAALTGRLIRGYGEPWTHELMERAATSVRRFSRARFEERLWEILDAHQLLSRRAGSS